MRCDPAVLSLTECFINRVLNRMQSVPVLNFEKMKNIITGAKNTTLMAFHSKLVFDHIKFVPLDTSPWIMLEAKTEIGTKVIEELKSCGLLNNQSSLSD